MTSSAHSPFNFDHVFDGPGDDAGGANGAARARYSEDELNAIRLEAIEQGRDEGMAAARQGLEHAASESLAGIGAQIAALETRQAAAIEEIRGEAAELAFEIAAKLAPTLIRREPLREVMELIADCLARMPTEPRIVIRVAEDLVEVLEDRLQAIATRSGFSGALVLLGEPSLQGADCRVEWADGGAERDLAAVRESIAQSVARYVRTRTAAAEVGRSESGSNLAEAGDGPTQPLPSEDSDSDRDPLACEQEE